MKKYSKKIALILALSLVLAFGIPALAADGSTVITGTYNPQPVKVIVPQSSSAFINPYGLPVELKDASDNVIATVSSNQIVAAQPMAGYNYGTVDLKVGASVIGEPKGSFKLGTAAPAPGETAKTGLVFFEVKNYDATDLGYTTGKDTDPAYINGLEIDKIADELSSWGKSYSASSPSQILVGTREATKPTNPGMITLKAADANGDPTTGSCFVANLCGDLVKAPKDPWVKSDGVKVTISWTFEPDI